MATLKSGFCSLLRFEELRLRLSNFDQTEVSTNNLEVRELKCEIFPTFAQAMLLVIPLASFGSLFLPSDSPCACCWLSLVEPSNA